MWLARSINIIIQKVNKIKDQLKTSEPKKEILTRSLPYINNHPTPSNNKQGKKNINSPIKDINNIPTLNIRNFNILKL